MLAFKVYAGSILCGRLYVIPSISHSFITVNNAYMSSSTIIARVAGYKQLRLVRYI